MRLIGLLFALALQEPDRQPQTRELAHQLYTAYVRSQRRRLPEHRTDRPQWPAGASGARRWLAGTVQRCGC